MKKLLLSILLLVPLYTSAMLKRCACPGRSSTLLSSIRRMPACQSKRLFTEETNPTETETCLEQHAKALELLDESEKIVSKPYISPEEQEMLWTYLHESKRRMANVSSEAECRIATISHLIRIRQESRQTKCLAARVERLEKVYESLLNNHLAGLIEDSDR